MAHELVESVCQVLDAIIISTPQAVDKAGGLDEVVGVDTLEKRGFLIIVREEVNPGLLQLDGLDLVLWDCSDGLCVMEYQAFRASPDAGQAFRA